MRQAAQATFTFYPHKEAFFQGSLSLEMHFFRKAFCWKGLSHPEIGVSAASNVVQGSCAYETVHYLKLSS